MALNNFYRRNHVYTLTFSSCGENHRGNEKIGDENQRGFESSFFEKISSDSNVKTHNLAENLNVPQNMEAFLATYENFAGEDKKKIEDELGILYWDCHKWDSDTRTVQEKHARSNTIFCYPEALPSYNGKAEMPDFNAYEKEFQDSLARKQELEKDYSKLIVSIENHDKYADKIKFRKTLSKQENEIYSQYETVCKKIKAIPHGIEVTKTAIDLIKKNQLEIFLLQYPDYLRGKGTVYNINHLPYISKLSDKVRTFCFEHGYVFDKKAFVIEGNNYHDIEQCYIGFHGDTEREVVFGLRFGNINFPLYFGWWYKNYLVENSLRCFVFKSGDAYMMARKTVGKDWKQSSIYTLRHAAGDLLTLEKEKSLSSILNKDKFFMHKVLDPTLDFIKFLSSEDKEFALNSAKKLYLLHQKKSLRKKSAEDTLIEKFQELEKLYHREE